MAHFGAIDPEIQAMCGWCSITGKEGGRGEMFRHLGHIDLTTSTYITQAVLQALLARERTGKGQKIEIEMLRAAMAIQTTRLARILCHRGAAPADGQRQRHRSATSGVPLPGPKIYRGGRGEGGAMAGIVPRAEGSGQLISDPRFAPTAARVEHRAELIPILAQRF